MAEGGGDWTEAVLAKAGTRLCEHPARVHALKELLRVRQKGNEDETRNTAEAILGLEPVSVDILLDIEKGLGLIADREYVAFPEKEWRRQGPYGSKLPSSIFTTHQSVREFRVEANPRGGDSPGANWLEAFIKEEQRILLHALTLKRDAVVKDNRRVMKRQAKRRINRFHGEAAARSIRKWRLGALQWERATILKKELTSSRINDDDGSKLACIGRVEHLPTAATSIPLKSTITPDEEDPFLKFVPGYGPKFSRIRELMSDIVDLNQDFVTHFDEEAFEEVIYQSVLFFGPTDWVVAALASALSLRARLVRRVCAEVSLFEAPTFSNKALPFKVRDTADASILIDSFRTLFCPRCCLFDCKLHGLVLPPKRSRAGAQPASHIMHAIHSSGDQRVSQALTNHCARLFPDSSEKAEALMAGLMGRPISSSLDLRHSRNNLKGLTIRQRNATAAPHPATRRSRIVRWHSPCNHDGPCQGNPECSCFAKNRYCEFDCGCDANEDREGNGCGNIFAGCRCVVSASDEGVAGKCCSIRKQCECKYNGRECSPHLCGCAKGACYNQNMQKDDRPALAVGFSDIHEGGWGAFASRKIAKGEFIGEYCGEMISDSEGEKRGFVYDEILKSSFLFDLCTRDRLVDSFRRGTETKWINYACDQEHSSSDSLLSFSEDSGSESDAGRKGSRRPPRKKQLVKAELVEENDVFEEEEPLANNNNGTNPVVAQRRIVAVKHAIKTVFKKSSAPLVALPQSQPPPATATATAVQKQASSTAAAPPIRRWLSKSPDPSAGGSSEGRGHQRKKKFYSNCSSSVMCVDGEPRICLFARRDIEKGEELCFNYGKFKLSPSE